MKHGKTATTLVSLALVAGAVLCVRAKHDGEAEVTESGSGLREDEKARIRSFWKHFRCGRRLQLEGRWQEAVSEFEEALRLDPRHEDTLYNLANSLFELDRFEDALGNLERLVAVNALSQRAHRQIGCIHACPLAGPLFDLERAEQAFRRAFEINQEETGSILRLAEVALVEGDDERAFELFSLANRSNFRDVAGYYLRAWIRWKAGRVDEARELFEAAVRQSGKPVVVAGVPREGDTRPGSTLPRTTLPEKLLIRPFWAGLADRHRGQSVEASSLGAEFEPLDAYLREIRSRL